MMFFKSSSSAIWLLARLAPAIAVLSVLGASPTALAYDRLEADFATCTKSNEAGAVVAACSRLIANARVENEMTGMFYGIRATYNNDRARNCADARKASQLIKDPKMTASLNELKKKNCPSGGAAGSREKQSAAPSARKTIMGRACGQHLDSYVARLGRADHYNSSGERLTSVPAILRQDRANVHVFGQADAEDESDRYFSSKDNRAHMEALLAAGTMSGPAAEAILNDTPLVRVTVCSSPDAIFVEVAR